VIKRKLIALLLMLLLPLQGLATAFAPLIMAGTAADTSMPCHAHLAEGHGSAVTEPSLASAGHDSPHHASHAAATDAPAEQSPHEPDNGAHACCHPVFSCAPGCMSAAPAQSFSDKLRFSLTLATLYIPDSPDRPPRG
jgi:hypothetical protein